MDDAKPMTIAEFIAAHPVERDKPFKPHAWYNEAGDMIEAYFTSEPCYAESLAPGIDLYRSFETQEIVGVQINGVKRLITEGLK